MTPDTLRYPGQAWETHAASEAVGWSGDLLGQATAYAESIGSLAGESLAQLLRLILAARLPAHLASGE